MLTTVSDGANGSGGRNDGAADEAAARGRRTISQGSVHARRGSERRGYLRLDLTRERLQAELVAMESVAQRESGKFVQAVFVVEDGKAGAVTAGV